MPRPRHRTPDRHRFRDKRPEEYGDPDLNPYLKLHREMGPPVLTAEQAAASRGQWPKHFGRRAPLHVEIGSGNGFFLAGMACRFPSWNWLGVELRFKRVVLTARRLLQAEAENARIARYDAFWMDDLFEPGSVSAFYVNHPDPWPKERHAKNRLIAPSFLALAAALLQEEGFLRLKTDAHHHLDALESSVTALPLQVEGRVDDIAAQGLPWPEDTDMVTNYQRKSGQAGRPVGAMWVRRLRD